MNSPFFSTPAALKSAASPLPPEAGPCFALARHLAREKLLAMGFGALLALVFCVFYLQHTTVMSEADPRLLAEFRGNRPYQLRILMPLLARWSAQLTGLDIARCYQLLLFLVSFAFFPVFTAYLRQFCAPRAANWLALSLAGPLFAFYSHKWFYPYDVPAAFLATLGLLLMAQKRWKGFLLVFCLATLNRETSAFLTLAFVFTLHNTLPRRQFRTLLAAQIGIWLALRAGLSLVFAANAGKPFEWQIAGNVAEMAGIFSFPSHLWLYPSPLNTGSTLVTLLGLWAIGLATRRDQPEFLGRSRHVFWPFLAAMSIVGALTETRIYSELIPILLAPALVGLFHRIAPPSAMPSSTSPFSA